MSLDVYLETNETVISGAKIYIREGGQTKGVSSEEWQEKFPGTEPMVIAEHETSEVYSGNITHNLNWMASEAGIYEHLWRPDEIEIKQAKELIEPLGEGLALLKSEPDRFKEFNPENGWGDYDGLIEFVEGYLDACKEYPEATVSVSR